jgi:hypothetical protein
MEDGKYIVCSFSRKTLKSVIIEQVVHKHSALVLSINVWMYKATKIKRIQLWAFHNKTIHSQKNQLYETSHYIILVLQNSLHECVIAMECILYLAKLFMYRKHYRYLKH